MPDAPKDQTISQVVSEAKPLLAEAPEKIEQAEQALNQFLDLIAINTPSGAAAHTQAAALKAGLKSGVIQADQAIEGVQKLLHQFAFPLTLVGGVKVQGSGQLAAAGASAFQGLESAMTQAQKYTTVAVTVLQCVIVVAGVILTFFPQFGAYGLVGGLTISKLIGIGGTLLNVKNSKYPDAPRAELVALPKS